MSGSRRVGRVFEAYWLPLDEVGLEDSAHPTDSKVAAVLKRAAE